MPGEHLRDNVSGSRNRHPWEDPSSWAFAQQMCSGNTPYSAALQPYYGLVTLLSLGSSIKQILHMVFISEQAMDVGSAFTIALFNTILNTINTLLSLWAVTSPVTPVLDSSSFINTLLSPPVAVGVAAYAIGLSVEAISEFQRKAFKQDPRNKGKPYGGGLFSLATNINYGAYTVWRSAYALTCGGFVWSATTFAFFFRDFATRGVPVLDEYMTQRYGDAYRDIKSRVRYSLIPGIY
ncbi:uncharacterized protein N7458_011364 [Penicillium daleae]|uniref:Steroid 5-alpha reductase C-terminal domain-containing protein n=1 Tax=Penicillium daleae TaxID=63821 RepID=A0AAD6FVY7_9EURO|nr:uncharacterized protein N7458_011364 [Penicillium daleae]KAJ5432208.1 hypothetical protein N7458_011364 [Penicillium daleae]